MRENNMNKADFNVLLLSLLNRAYESKVDSSAIVFSLSYHLSGIILSGACCCGKERLDIIELLKLAVDSEQETLNEGQDDGF